MSTILLLSKSLDSFSGIKETNLKKERRKNLVPAKVGVYSLIILIIYGTFYCILYSIPIDLGVRQFSISFVADFIFCVAHPIVLIYNASVIRHRLVDTIKVYGSYLVELFTNNWINDKRKSKEDLDYDIQFYPPLQFSRNHIECLLWSKSYISNRQTDIGLTAVVIQRFWYDYRSNKMEPLQSQSPAKRELLGSSVVRT